MKYHGLVSTTRKVPFTNIPTASDFLHQPVKQVCR